MISDRELGKASLGVGSEQGSADDRVASANTFRRLGASSCRLRGCCVLTGREAVCRNGENGSREHGEMELDCSVLCKPWVRAGFPLTEMGTLFKGLSRGRPFHTMGGPGLPGR